MKTVPTSPHFVPTVPTSVGTLEMADFCGLHPPVPTVPTYNNINNKRGATVPQHRACVSLIGTEVGTEGTGPSKAQKSAKNHRSYHTVPSSHFSEMNP